MIKYITILCFTFLLGFSFKIIKVEKIIYEKLGGTEGLYKLLDEIVEEYLKNEKIKH
ncbi:MAG: hypothetical protein JKY73_05340 [Lutibacter sp.]|nr:hypothetical protein [Lutibacter sp.]